MESPLPFPNSISHEAQFYDSMRGKNEISTNDFGWIVNRIVSFFAVNEYDAKYGGTWRQNHK